MQETRVQFLGQEDPLEKEMATHSSIPAWRIPWTEEPGGLQSTGSQESDTTGRLNHHHHLSICLWIYHHGHESEHTCHSKSFPAPLVIYLFCTTSSSSRLLASQLHILNLQSQLTLRGLPSKPWPRNFLKSMKNLGGFLNLFLTSEGSLMTSILKTIVSLILCFAIIALDGNLNIVYYFSLSWRFFYFLIHSLFVLWTAHIT